MNQKQKLGIWIRQPDNRDEGKCQWLIPLLIALAASVLFLLTATELTEFHHIYSPWAMIAGAAGICIAYGVLIKLHRENWFYVGFLALLLLQAVLCGKMILDGACMFWNHAGDVWTAGYGWAVPRLQSGETVENTSLALLLFSIFLSGVTAVLFCGLAFWKKNILLALLPMVIFFGMAAFQRYDMGVYLIATLTFAIFVLLSGRNQGEEEPVKAMVFRWIPVILCSIVLVSAASAPAVKNYAEETGRSVHEKIHEARYETDYTTLPEGNFDGYKAAKEDAHPALAVSMEQTEELYLRGFTATEFTGDSWLPLDGDVVAKERDLLYWMNQNSWNPKGMFAQAFALTDNSEEEENPVMQTVTVQNLNGCSKYMYVPYTLYTEDYLEEEQIHPDGIMAHGKRMYQYTMVTGGTERIQQILEKLQKQSGEEMQAYHQAEQAYREFVYEHYLEIPEAVEIQLKPYWKEIEKEYGKKEKMSAEEKQKCVKAFLNACFPENGEAPELSLPLDAAKGSSYQYATAAAMTLRYFGIPARYAEGYTITKEMADNADNDSTIQVDSSCGGAWAEVYQDGLGWIPMALTPGIEDETMGLNLDETGDVPEEIPPEAELQEKPDKPLEEQSLLSESVVILNKELPLPVILGVLALLLAALILVLRHRVILRRRMNKWNDGDAKDALPVIFADTAGLLNRLGFSRGKGSMMDLQKPIQDAFGETYGKSYLNMVKLNSRAMFSSKTLEETYREVAKAFYRDTLNLMTADAKWYKKLWMQWILCLY